MQIIRNGGLGNGGTNFDAKTRRNSTDLEDIFIAHIAGMDAMARALESAAALLNESPYCKMLSDRYASFDSGKGKEFEEGKLTTEAISAIMSEEKPNQREKIVLRGDRVRSLIPKNIPINQTEEYVCKALEHYNRFLRNRAERDSR